MKHTSRTIDRGAVRRRSWPPGLCLLLVLFLLSGTNVHLAWSQASEQPTISVKAQDRPLGAVLADIARETGYRISINDQWKEHRVQVAFRDKPLDKALKYILADFNHAIFFGPDKLIKIVIYSPKDYSQSESAEPRTYYPEPQPEPPPAVEEDLTEPSEPVPVEQDEKEPEEPAERGEAVEEREPDETAEGETSAGDRVEEVDQGSAPEEQEPGTAQDQDPNN